MDGKEGTMGMDNGMGPGPGRSASDYSGSPRPRYCSGCGVEMGSYTPAEWEAEEMHETCGEDPHKYEDEEEEEEYGVRMPATPGASMSTVATCSTLAEARGIARSKARTRPDLTRQDIEIRKPDGGIEYAGPDR